MLRKIVAALLSAVLLLPAGALGAMEAEIPVDLKCRCALLMEPGSGQVIFESGADERRPVASVVKILPILLAIEAVEQGRVRLEDVFTVSPAASGMGGSQVLLDTGETQPFSNLLKSMIVSSANDATVAVAEALFGSERAMVRRMNERAGELGMRDSVFLNATGLPAKGQYTTARDVSRMAAELIRHELFFDYSGIWMDALDHGDGRVTEMTNTNRLTRLYEGCDGVKTGSTSEAGYCMAATASRGGMRLLAVVLGAPSSKERFATASALLDYGFANYRSVAVAEKGGRLRLRARVTGGARDSAALMLDGDLTILIPKGEEKSIELVPAVAETLPAPVTEGDPAGSVEVVVDGRTVGKIPVAAAETIPKRRYGDGLRLIIQRWLSAGESGNS